MRKLTNFIVTITAAILVLFVLTGCATHRAEARAKLPIAETICLQVEGVKEPEKGLFLRKAKALLVERNFRVVDTNCDIKEVYTAMDEGQWEIMDTSLFGLHSKSSYRVEGLVSIWKRSGELVSEDQPINLRDYDSKTEIMEDLAQEFIEHVTDNYRPN